MHFSPAMFHKSLIGIYLYSGSPHVVVQVVHCVHKGVTSHRLNKALSTYAEQTYPALRGSLIWPTTFLSHAGSYLLRKDPWINHLYLPNSLLIKSC